MSLVFAVFGGNIPDLTDDEDEDAAQIAPRRDATNAAGEGTLSSTQGIPPKQDLVMEPVEGGIGINMSIHQLGLPCRSSTNRRCVPLS